MEYADKILELLTNYISFPVIATIVVSVTFVISYPKIETGFSKILKLGENIITERKFKNIVNWDEYLHSLRRSYSKTRSIISPKQEMDFHDLYVSPPLSFEERGAANQHIRASTMHITEDLHKERSKILLVSDAGSGKSMAAQDIFLKILDKGKKIPVFFPLHYVNGKPHKDYTLISKFIYERFFSSINGFSLNMFYRMEQKGKFIYILDGYDEIDFRLVPHFLPVLDSWFLNQKCGILISTRPGTKLHRLAETKSYKMSPFGEVEIQSLIERFKRLAPEKAMLLESAIYKGLLKAPESFLSNPLLATVLLLGVKESSA